MASRLQDVVLRGTAALRPLATAVAPGTLYYSTDTGVLERSNGTIWESYSAAVGVPLHAPTHSLGGTDPVSVVNLAGFPGGAVNFLRADGTFAAPPGAGGVGGADFTNAGHPQGIVTGVGGQTCRDTTSGILYIKRSLASSAWGWYPIFGYGDVNEAACPMSFSWHAAPPGNAIAGDSLALQGNGITFASSGTVAHAAFRAADSYYMNLTTGVAAGNYAELYDNNYTASRFQWSLGYNFDLTFKIRLPSAIADQRFWLGLFSTDPTNADTLTGTAVGFRYSSVIGAQWDGVVRDGTTTNVLSNVGAVAVDTAYLLRIRRVGGTVYFSVNNGPELSTSTNVPTNTNIPYIVIITFNITGAGGTARSFNISRMGCIFGS